MILMKRSPPASAEAPQERLPFLQARREPGAVQVLEEALLGSLDFSGSLDLSDSQEDAGALVQALEVAAVKMTLGGRGERKIEGKKR